MAERRMFAKSIVTSDAFLDMPMSARCLYFTLGMFADDEGFIGSPKSIMRQVGATQDDMQIIISKKFVILFDSGVIVIKHWRIHNYIRNDRLKKTNYTEERALLCVKENGAYTFREDVEPVKAIEEPEKHLSAGEELRKQAYAESSLPYSFDYKIRQAFSGEKCPICGFEMRNSRDAKHRPTIQHNVPIAKGGKHELDNISVICHACNVSIQDTETDNLNNAEVLKTWDKIVSEDRCRTDDGQMTDKCQSDDGQMTDRCQTSGSIGKDRLGKDRLGKDRLNNIYSPAEPDDEPDSFSENCKEIIAYLNETCGTAYRASSKATQRVIHARLNEGFTVEDFKTVIYKKAKQWKDDAKMCAYLRPQTLFGTKFESYLNEKETLNAMERWDSA